MANLFGRNKLIEKASSISTEEVIPFIGIVKAWHHDYYYGTLKNDKETSREQAYNQDFFINILGYKEKPSSSWSFEPKATTDKGQLPDAVIGFNGENISAVVELKGAGIPLDKPQQREVNMSPVQQAFKYKTQYRRCPFVIVSNFYEFRLYQDNQLDYEVWTLDDLVSPVDDYLNFKSWYVLVRAANFITEVGPAKTEILLSDIRVDQEAIGERFYQQYKIARIELLRDLWKQNEVVREDIGYGIEKAQKIIDRLVFVCFAEDRGLLPDNILLQVLESAKNSAFGGSIWNALKGFFDAIDTGSDKLEIPNGYNGGLFRSDTGLNNLHVNDEALLKVAELGKYDFREDLSVNILGHIFEQSISDLEEIKHKVFEEKLIEHKVTKKRKEDGIFYTPDYIVRYIVENTLGTYLREHEEEFIEEAKLKGDIAEETYTKREKQAYTKYLGFLQNIKILDPACGSGAFLVYVFDYLLAENKRVDEILGNTLFGTEDYVRSIMHNNIYGVDINSESIEITKLSLWLKTAQKGKHLTALDDNIKCGNSLIDDQVVAGRKAFVWQEEFPVVFSSGGFDVIVGNPPYGADIDNYIEFYESRYPDTSKGYKDIYKYFFSRSLQLLKDGGSLGFITPNTFLRQPRYGDLRRLLLSQTINQLVDLGDNVFDVVVPTSISVVSKLPQANNLVLYADLTRQSKNQGYFDSLSFTKVEQSHFEKTSNNMFIVAEERFYKNDYPLGELLHMKDAGINYQRVEVGLSDKGNSDLSKRLFYEGLCENDSDMEYYKGSDIDRYYIKESTGRYVRTDILLADNERVILNDEYFSITPKLIWRQTASYPIASIDYKGVWFGRSIQAGVIKEEFRDRLSYQFLCALLNSKYTRYLYESIVKEAGRVFPQVKLEKLKILPVIIALDQQQYVSKVDRLFRLNSEVTKTNWHLAELLAVEYGHIKTLSNWWAVDFSVFYKSLKINLTLPQKDELLILWEKYQPLQATLNAEISALNQDIDQLIYALYNLTPEEIAIVERV